jgi:hypothetical protein
MPTKNRRIATYLPQEIDAAFKAFKSDRNIEGDSQALITILSEFLGVSQQVAYQGSLLATDLEKRVEALEARIAQIKNELRDELLSELPLKSEGINALAGQLNLLADELEGEQIELPVVDANDESISGGLTGSELAKRIGVDRSTIGKWKRAGTLAKNTATRLPDKAPWRYDETKKLYFLTSIEQGKLPSEL